MIRNIHRLLPIAITIILVTSIAQVANAQRNSFPSIPDDPNLKYVPPVGQTRPVRRPTAPRNRPNDVHIRSYHIHMTQSGLTPMKAFNVCAKEAWCKGVLEAAATYVGVPPGTISAISRVTLALGKTQGQSTSYEWPSPGGWKVCRVTVKFNSTAPQENYPGRHMPTFAVSANPNRAGAFLQVPGGKYDGARSWFDGLVTITYVQRSSRRRCNIGPRQAGYSCRNKASGCNGTIDLGRQYKTLN